MKISIIIPCYNEEKTIEKIIDKVRDSMSSPYEIIVIDDGSTDKTGLILENNLKNKINKILINEKNYGKGYSVKKGIEVTNGDIIIIQDADLEYDPKDIEKFLAKINKNQADCIMGSRFTGNERSVLNFWHMIGNKFITLLFNFMNNTAFTDIYCCYCLFHRTLVKPEQLKSKGWGQQAEILTYVVKNSKKIYEIAVNYNGRTYDDGKKITWRDGFAAIYHILRYNLSPRSFFLIFVSFFMCCYFFFKFL